MDFKEQILRGLNPQQAEAVQHGDGPLLILAGAGSGKTRVITHRIAWLVSVRGVSPGAILAITFTNKAAEEMKTRVETLVGPTALSMWIGTFHAMMVRILRRFADRIGYSRSFAILDSDDQLRVVRQCIRELELDEKIYLPKAVHSQISSAKNELTDAAEFSRMAGQNVRQAKIAQIFVRYQDKLKRSNSLDFDDILLETVRLLGDHPDVLALYQERFQYILVDEYQDTNRAQYQLVRLLSARRKNLCVVGDDDQSIYSFRGAQIQNILDFEKDFRGCKVILLEQNYRSTGTVLKAANSVIGQNKGRKKKTLWTRSGDGEPITFLRAENHNAEGLYIAQEISRQARRAGRRRYGDFAILYRLNALSRSLEAALHDQGIPYRIFGGMRFYDRKEIKDVIAYLRLILIPGDDLSLVRAIQVPRRGIGETTLESLSQAAARAGKSQLAVCGEAGRYTELARQAGRLQGFAAQIGQFQARLLENELSLPAFIEWVENESGLIQDILDQEDKTRSGEPADRIENLRELLSDAVEFADHQRVVREQGAAAGLDSASLDSADSGLASADLAGALAAFLERAALASDLDEDRDRSDYVRLMTIHSAKGLEFDTVFLVGAEEGLFPGYRAMDSESSIEEERRLAYVAMTRARNKLHITATRSRLVFGQTQSFAVSRFIREIPDEFVEEIGGSRFGDRPGGPAFEPGWGGARSGELSASRALPTPAARFSAAADILRQAGTSVWKPEKAAASLAGVPSGYQKGDRVRHARFGSGRILAVEPVAGDAILLIEFASGEQKRMMARTANLEKI